MGPAAPPSKPSYLCCIIVYMSKVRVTIEFDDGTYDVTDEDEMRGIATHIPSHVEWPVFEVDADLLARFRAAEQEMGSARRALIEQAVEVDTLHGNLILQDTAPPDFAWEGP